MNTLARDHALIAQLHVRGSDEPDWSAAVHFVFAPCCGRSTAADTILDVRNVPGTIVAGGGVRAPEDHDWLCDGCRQRLYVDPNNGWTRSRLYNAVGSDPEHLRQIYARELLDQVEYWEGRSERGHRPTDALEAILAALPEGVNPFAQFGAITG